MGGRKALAAPPRAHSSRLILQAWQLPDPSHHVSPALSFFSSPSSTPRPVPIWKWTVLGCCLVWSMSRDVERPPQWCLGGGQGPLLAVLSLLVREESGGVAVWCRGPVMCFTPQWYWEPCWSREEGCTPCRQVNTLWDASLPLIEYIAHYPCQPPAHQYPGHVAEGWRPTSTREPILCSVVKEISSLESGSKDSKGCRIHAPFAGCLQSWVLNLCRLSRNLPYACWCL